MRGGSAVANLIFLGQQPIYFNLNPVNFLIISGLLQNFILSGILFFRKSDNPTSSKILSVIIFIATLHLANLMVLDTNLDNLFPSILWLPYSYLAAVGPLIFLYTNSFVNSDFKMAKKYIPHFIPAAVELLFQVIQIANAANRNILYYNAPLYFHIVSVLYLWTAISIFYYLRLSLLLINNHESWVLKNYSNLKDITLAWLLKLISYYRILWMIWIPFILAFLLFFRFQLLYLIVVALLYFLMTILTYLTYWIGLEGLRRVNVVFLKPEITQSLNKNYNHLTTEEVKEYVQRIELAMVKEKLFLNENLSLRDLAKSVETDPNLVSFILNTGLKKNFYEFINSYRIEEVKARLNNPAYKHLTILGIALESGFNSKTSFNRVFKQLTGQTPSEFQKQS